MEHHGYEERTADDSLHMELRNPSDALQILARSSDVSSNRPSSHHRRQQEHVYAADAPTSRPMPGPSSSVDSVAAMSHVDQDRSDSRPPTTALDTYELVQRGLLHPSVLPELLLMLASRIYKICEEFD